MRLTIALLSLTAATASGYERVSTVMEARVHFDALRRLELLGDLAGELDICTWEEDELGGWLVINTTAEELARIQMLGLRTEVTWPDIRHKFRAITGVDPDDPAAGRDFGYFFTYWETIDTLQALAAAFPGICTLYSVGLSHQGKPLWCLKVSDNAAVSENEPACFFNGATHAREPMGTHCCIMFAARILSQYGVDSLATWLINNREVFIIPVMNPDGYVYNSDSGGSTNNWRKNRRVIQSPYVGVDLNRNYGFKWGYDNSGSSGSPAQETYRGPSRFSEPETQVVRDFMAANLFRTCMDYHTYGQYNLYPWGYASTTPPERNLLQEMVDTFRMNNNYRASRTGQVNQTIYPCNGLSLDWEYSDTAGKFVTYAFTCELDSIDFWHGWNDSAALHLECNRNIPNLYYLARVSGVFFDPVAVTINDTTLGNGTGRLDPGEQSNIWFSLRNRAVHPLDSAYQVSARLISGHPEVQVTDSVKSFPNCARRSGFNNASTQFTLRAGSGIAPGTRIPLRLELSYTDAGVRMMQPVGFEIVIGDQSGVAHRPALDIPTSLAARPNPAGSFVRFQAHGSTGPIAVRIYSCSGALVATASTGTGFDCRSLPAGAYSGRTESGASCWFTVVR
uniref:carboxypeptidase T n=1 Tax=candidate division WOR-3 bacterium TaxID=2052148 RepID=A0A7C4CAU8_UNCW3